MKTVAVIFGGKSTEHDVSIVTALVSVIKPLELLGNYRVEAVYITKDGAWYCDDRLKDISLYSSGRIDEFLVKENPVQLLFADGFKLIKQSRFGKKNIITVDIAFPATHGTYGEDGSLMGLLRMAGVAYVGCDMESSVIAMNKLLAHEVVEAAGIVGYPYVGLSREQFGKNKEEALKQFDQLKYPLFVKPVRLGSSIGISRINNKHELGAALETVFAYDTTAIVEQAVSNLIEVTVPVIGRGNNIQVACVERPLVNERALFDFETKYMNQGKGGKKMGQKGSSGAQGYSEIPAKINGSLYKASEQLARDVYQAIGCEGIARVDLLIDSKNEKVYFNEINPLPGSLYAHNWRVAGVSNVELVDKLIQYALDRQKEQIDKTTTNFSTNFLKQF